MNLIKFLFLLLLSSFLTGCATNSLVIGDKSAESNHGFIRKIDYSNVPQIRELAERARAIGNENYPKILALLTNDSSKFPQQFDIVFKRHLRLRQFGEQEPAGYVVGTTIYLDVDVFLNPTNSDWIGDDPTNFHYHPVIIS
jgi:hypothetical protein